MPNTKIAYSIKVFIDIFFKYNGSAVIERGVL